MTFRSVIPAWASGPVRFSRDLGLVSPGCPCGSGVSECCSSVWLPAWLPCRATARALPAVFKSVSDSLSGSVATWAFSGHAHHVTQDHPVYIPRDVNCSASLLLLSAQPWVVRRPADPDRRATGPEDRKRRGRATHYEPVPCVVYGSNVRAGVRFTGCCWWRRSSAVDGGSGASRGHASANWFMG